MTARPADTNVARHERGRGRSGDRSVRRRQPGLPAGARHPPLRPREEVEHLGGRMAGGSAVDAAPGEDPGVREFVQPGPGDGEGDPEQALCRPGGEDRGLDQHPEEPRTGCFPARSGAQPASDARVGKARGPRPRQGSDLGGEVPGLVGGCAGRVDEDVDPPPDGVRRRRLRRVALVAVLREPGDVAVPQRGEGEADGQDARRCEPPAREDGVDERPPHPPVAVGERMDGLELRVDERRLHQWRVHRTVEVADQIRRAPPRAAAGRTARRRAVSTGSSAAGCCGSRLPGCWRSHGPGVASTPR